MAKNPNAKMPSAALLRRDQEVRNAKVRNSAKTLKSLRGPLSQQDKNKRKGR